MSISRRDALKNLVVGSVAAGVTAKAAPGQTPSPKPPCGTVP